MTVCLDKKDVYYVSIHEGQPIGWVIENMNAKFIHSDFFELIEFELKALDL